MGYLRDFIEHVAESFTTLFNLEADPALTEHENVERVIAHTATVAAIVCCVQPIPAADFLILTPIQAKMALHIGRVKGFEVTQERAHEIVVEVLGVLGMTLTAQLLVVSVAKLLPIVGGMLSIPLIYAATWAIGNVVDYYFDCLRADKAPSAQVMKDLFTEQFRVGKQKGQQLDRSELERKAEELRRRVAERDADLVTETRLDPRRQDPPRRSSASAAPPPPAEGNGGGRRKIKITLGPGGDSRRTDDEPIRGKKKTIGFGDALPGEEDPDALHLAPPGTPLGEVPPPPSARKTVGGPPPPTAAPPASASAPSPTPVSAPAKEGEAPSFVDQLERLGKLRDAGVLSADEFEQAKRKILGL